MKCANTQVCVVNYSFTTEWGQNQATVKAHLKCKKSLDFNVTQYEKLIYIVTNPQATVVCGLSIFDVASKKNGHNYLKKLLKLSSLFQLHIYVKLNFYLLFTEQYVATN